MPGPLTLPGMDLRRRTKHRIEAIIDYSLTEKDLIGIFLNEAEQYDSDRLRVTPTTRECLRTLQIHLWLYGMEATSPPAGITLGQQDYAQRCTRRVLNSRLVKPSGAP